jgi:hypothetical protein
MPRSNATKQTWEIGDRIKFYQHARSTDEIVTKVYLRGNTGFSATLTNSAHTGTLQKQRIMLVPSIATVGDAVLWGTSYFAKFGTAQPSGTLRLGATDAWIENVTGQSMPPLGRLRVHGGPQFVSSGDRGDTFGVSGAQLPIRLGGALYGSTDQLYRIESIFYRPSETGLDIEIALGEKEILRLKKANAELVMELLKMRYDAARLLWKEAIKALGEPDPDEPARSRQHAESSKKGD